MYLSKLDVFPLHREEIYYLLALSGPSFCVQSHNFCYQFSHKLQCIVQNVPCTMYWSITSFLLNKQYELNIQVQWQCKLFNHRFERRIYWQQYFGIECVLE